MEIKEIWKTIEEYPNYQISSMGRVKSLNYNKTGKERILKQGIDKDNYCYIVLHKEGKQKNYKVHRLVATHFLPNPNNYPCINHKNESKTDNCVSNLEWCSYSYNNNYGTRNERMANTHKGMKRTQKTKDNISKAISKPILQFNKQGTKIIGKYNSLSQASNELNIKCSNISSCCKGKTRSCGGYKWMYLQDYIDRMEKLYNMVLKKAS